MPEAHFQVALDLIKLTTDNGTYHGSFVTAKEG